MAILRNQMIAACHVHGHGVKPCSWRKLTEIIYGEVALAEEVYKVRIIKLPFFPVSDHNNHQESTLNVPYYKGCPHARDSTVYLVQIKLRVSRQSRRGISYAWDLTKQHNLWLYQASD